ncbi:zinc-finger domain-containing protein [uncultured Bartonella sp.]|uniref:zinc-finger domain-containing protein n=1 Tax=uncultured Bartonella sp. TaxID=104108 RepID=UPI00262606CA|nr:zinc-finger domain-containing protein [uncultured Bartonella sp.]
MADHHIPHFHNDGGYKMIEIGVKRFMCAGANAPFDHPHIFLDMGADDEKICPYCSTLYRYNPSFSDAETKPAGCVYEPA